MHYSQNIIYYDSTDKSRLNNKSSSYNSRDNIIPQLKNMYPSKNTASSNNYRDYFIKEARGESYFPGVRPRNDNFNVGSDYQEISLMRMFCGGGCPVCIQCRK
ncbi:MAG: hypothetical protein QXK37_05585 [Candidatus Woesearchaeota archaeon]